MLFSVLSCLFHTYPTNTPVVRIVTRVGVVGAAEERAVVLILGEWILFKTRHGVFHYASHIPTTPHSFPVSSRGACHSGHTRSSSRMDLCVMCHVYSSTERRGSARESVREARCGPCHGAGARGGEHHRIQVTHIRGKVLPLLHHLVVPAIVIQQLVRVERVVQRVVQAWQRLFPKRSPYMS